MWIVFAKSTNSHFWSTFCEWLTIQHSLASLCSCVRQGLIHLPILLAPIPLMGKKMVDFGKSVLAANSRIVRYLIGDMANTFDRISSTALERLLQLP